MDGIEAGEAIRQQVNVRIVYLCVYIDAATMARAQATQPDAFLQKPFSDDHLQKPLEQVRAR